MNICDELRKIRERQSLIVAKMTFEEKKEFFRKGAEAVQREIDERRKRDLDVSPQKNKKA